METRLYNIKYNIKRKKQIVKSFKIVLSTVRQNQMISFVRKLLLNSDLYQTARRLNCIKKKKRTPSYFVITKSKLKCSLLEIFNTLLNFYE